MNYINISGYNDFNVRQLHAYTFKKWCFSYTKSVTV